MKKGMQGKAQKIEMSCKTKEAYRCICFANPLLQKVKERRNSEREEEEKDMKRWR
jgi:hypothetical protein